MTDRRETVGGHERAVGDGASATAAGATVEPGADVEPGARIGAGSHVWPGACVRSGARVGVRCTIGRGAYIDAGVAIGDGVKVQDRALLYAGTTVGDGVFVGPGAIVTNDRYPRSLTCEGRVATRDDWELVPTTIDAGASLGAGSVVVAGADIGRSAMVAAGGVVTRAVPAHALVAGVPARQVGWVCRCGRWLVDAGGQRIGAEHQGDAHCPEDGERYRVVAGVCGPGARSGSRPVTAAQEAGPGRRGPIPIAAPEIGPAEEALVVEVLRSGRLAMGPLTELFEERWAAYCGVRDAVLLANGTLAAEALLAALRIGPGDEVITVSFSFNATVSAILRVGATPVLVDIDPEHFLIDPAAVAAAVTSRTRAIVAVHLYGLMAPMDALRSIADRHAITLLEDAAQAHGATLGGRRAGSFGPATFSLYATKNLQAGEGGIVTTNDAALARRVRALRDHGRRGSEHVLLGSNLRPTEVGAALALAGLDRLDARNAQRRANAARLRAGLADYHVPLEPSDREHVWHQFTMRFPGERDRVAAALAERGIATGVHYRIPIHRQPYLRELAPTAAGRLPVTERVADEVLSLPVHPAVTEPDLERVIAAVREVATPARPPRTDRTPSPSSR